MPIIRTEKLSYVYSEGTPFEKTAISDINLEIHNGNFVGLIGHTGSGKSTLIQHFNGLLKPSSGKIYIDGKDIWENKSDIIKYRFKVGLAFQYPEYQLFEETIFKDIAFGPKNMGISSKDIEDRVYWAMDIVGIPREYAERSPFELSGGQKRRVALAGILSMDSDVIVLDEPTAGLDPNGRRSILQHIERYHKERKNTIILISHNMEDIANFCNHVIVMNKSRLWRAGTTKEIFADPDKLTAIGLSIPTISQVFLDLHNRKESINKNVYTVNQALEAVRHLIEC